MSETYNITHDINLLKDYILSNWRETQVESPDDIYYNQSILSDDNRERLQVIRPWMFQSCIKLYEDPTQYSLLDLRANADRINDTVITFEVYTKYGDHRALRMFKEFLYWVRKYAKTDNSGHYAFIQILDSEPRRNPYTGRYMGNLLLTRRGKGHDI